MEALAERIAEHLLNAEKLVLNDNELAVLREQLIARGEELFAAIKSKADRARPDNSWTLHVATSEELKRYFRRWADKLRMEHNGMGMYLVYSHAGIIGPDKDLYLMLIYDRSPLVFVREKTFTDGLVEDLASRIMEMVRSDTPQAESLTEAEYLTLEAQVRQLSFDDKFIDALIYSGTSTLASDDSWHLRVVSTEERNSNELYPIRPRGPAEYFVRTHSALHGRNVEIYWILAFARNPIIMGRRWDKRHRCTTCKAELLSTDNAVGVRHIDGSLDLYCSETCISRHACPLSTRQ